MPFTTPIARLAGRIAAVAAGWRRGRPQRLLVLAGTAAQAAETVGRLRPRAFDAFALAPCPDLRPLVDEFVPVGGAEEEALRDRCRLLARQIVADMAAQMPVDSELAAHVLPMVCEDYLFGSLRLARAVELAVADGRWDAVAVTASAHRRMFGALAETVARRRRPAAAVIVRLGAEPARQPPPHLPFSASALPGVAETLVVARMHDVAYRQPALRLAHAAEAALISTTRWQPAGSDGQVDGGLGGPPPPWLVPFAACCASRAAREKAAVAKGAGVPGLGEGIDAFLAKGLPDLACRVAAVEPLLDAVAPRRILVFAGRDAVARAVVLAGRRRGIATIDVQVVLQSAHPRYRRSLAHVFCALTEEQGRMYSGRFHTQHQRVIRLGSLRMPEIRAQFDAAGRDAARGEAGLGEIAGRVVLVATQPGFDAQAQACLGAVLSAAAAARPGGGVIIKPHPKEDTAFYARIIAAFPAAAARVAAPDSSTPRLLKAVDGVVTYCSNVGIEAAVLGLPVVAVNLSGRPYAADLAAMGVAIGVESGEALAEAVKAILSGGIGATGKDFLSSNPEFLSDPLYRLLGLADELAQDLQALPPPNFAPFD